MVNDSALSVYISSNLEEHSLKTSEKQWAHKLPWLETDKKIGNNKLKEQHNAGTDYLGVRARVCVWITTILQSESKQVVMTMKQWTVSI